MGHGLDILPATGEKRGEMEVALGPQVSTLAEGGIYRGWEVGGGGQIHRGKGM